MTIFAFGILSNLKMSTIAIKYKYLINNYWTGYKYSMLCYIYLHSTEASNYISVSNYVSTLQVVV